MLDQAPVTANSSHSCADAARGAAGAGSLEQCLFGEPYVPASWSHASFLRFMMYFKRTRSRNGPRFWTLAVGSADGKGTASKQVDSNAAKTHLAKPKSITVNQPSGLASTFMFKMGSNRLWPILTWAVFQWISMPFHNPMDIHGGQMAKCICVRGPASDSRSVPLTPKRRDIHHQASPKVLENAPGQLSVHHQR